jgi:hypothetical protein
MIKGKSPDFDCLGLSDASLNGKANWRAWRRLVDITSQRENELPANSIQVKMRKRRAPAMPKDGQDNRHADCDATHTQVKMNFVHPLQELRGAPVNRQLQSLHNAAHTHTITSCAAQPLQCRSFLIRDEIFPSFFLVPALERTLNKLLTVVWYF